MMQMDVARSVSNSLIIVYLLPANSNALRNDCHLTIFTADQIVDDKEL